MAPEDTRRTLGEQGEEFAAAYLKKHRRKILCRNYTCSFGEIDIVARHGKVVTFVEVKTRRSTRYGSPREAVPAGKQKKISAVALEFIQRYNLEDSEARFDVVAIQFSADGHTVELIENAFELAVA